MLYFDLKIVHVALACLLFATGVGSALYVIYARAHCSIDFQRQALLICWRLSWFFILPVGIIQALLGFSIIAVRSYSAHTLWVWMTYSGFFMAALFWVISLFFQMHYKDSLEAQAENSASVTKPCDKSYRAWLLFGSLTVVTLLVMLFFMANKVG